MIFIHTISHLDIFISAILSFDISLFGIPFTGKSFASRPRQRPQETQHIMGDVNDKMQAILIAGDEVQWHL